MPGLSRSWGRALVCAALAAGSGPLAAAPAAARYETTEIEVKAAFLYHFAQLVTWPEASDDGTKPIVIAIVGPDPFGKRLEATIGSETIRGRALRIERVERFADLSRAPHILFVGATDPPEVREALAAAGRSPVLTVGIRKGFALEGGMIEFRLTPDARVAFDINARAAEAAGLKLSSQLLKLARIVESRR